MVSERWLQRQALTGTHYIAEDFKEIDKLCDSVISLRTKILANQPL